MQLETQAPDCSAPPHFGFDRSPARTFAWISTRSSDSLFPHTQNAFKSLCQTHVSAMLFKAGLSAALVLLTASVASALPLATPLDDPTSFADLERRAEFDTIPTGVSLIDYFPRFTSPTSSSVFQAGGNIEISWSVLSAFLLIHDDGRLGLAGSLEDFRIRGSARDSRVLLVLKRDLRGLGRLCEAACDGGQ